MHVALLTALALSLRPPTVTAVERAVPTHVLFSAKPNPRSIRTAAVKARNEELQHKNFTYPLAIQQIYRNNQYGISVRYPTGWEVQRVMQQGTSSLSSIIVFLSPLETENDVSRENINLIMEKLSSPTLTLEKYTAAALENEGARFNNYTLTASHDLLLHGMLAHRVTFTGSLSEGKTAAFEQIWLLKNGTAFVWSLASAPAAFDRYAQIFRQMLETAEFSER